MLQGGGETRRVTYVLATRGNIEDDRIHFIHSLFTAGKRGCYSGARPPKTKVIASRIWAEAWADDFDDFMMAAMFYGG
jgi:hypothetical protein